MEWISVDKMPQQTGAYLITDGRMMGEGYWSPANSWEGERVVTQGAYQLRLKQLRPGGADEHAGHNH